MTAIKVTVHLFSMLRQGRFSVSDIDLEEGATVTDLLDRLDLDTSHVEVVMVNAKSGTFIQRLNEGDRITLIPPIGGG